MRDQLQGVGFADAVFVDETRKRLFRKFRHRGANLFDPFVGNFKREKIRIREVPVVHRVFLRSHFACFVIVRVIETCGLYHFSAFTDQSNLAANFVVDSGLKEFKAVQVFNFAAGSEFFLALGSDRDVGVAAEITFLHIAVADADPHNEFMQRFCVCNGFCGASQFRFRNDFQKRRSGTVQIDTGFSMHNAVNAFARVFFKVRAGQINSFLVGASIGVFDLEADSSADDNGQFELADLIGLR